MLSAVLAVVLSSTPNAWCDNIRAIRALAHRDKLDEATLATLESRYCVAMPEGKGAAAADGPAKSGLTLVSSDCAELWTLAVLARADRDFGELPGIDAQVRQSCIPGGRDTEGLRWPSGRLAHQGDAWWYPSGKGAKKGASWWDPSGRAAHAEITWWYPSGKLARSGDVWFDPTNGGASTPEALMTWHCASHPELCNPRLSAMRGVSDDGHTAGTIELLLATP
jgi:hypothetical protein